MAIVGGGVSGLYSAWRLLGVDNEPIDPDAATTKPSVTVFEAGKRLGGRLLSPTPPDLPNLRAELGGMRYMSSQQLISKLIEHLHLDTDQLDADVPDNIAYLRSTHLRQKQLADSAVVPYELDFWEQGASPGAMTGRALDQVIPRLSSMTKDELAKTLQTRQVDGAYLWEWGFWNLLSRSLSHEAFRFAQKGMGYDTALHNWNAADTVIMNADFAPDAKYFRLRDGYEEVPYTLAKQFVAAGGTIERRHRLVEFDSCTLADGSDGVVLTFDVTSDDGSVVERSVRARSLILAMPRRSLELLEPTGPILADDQPEIRTLIESVTPNPLFKAALCYREPWWEATTTEPPPMKGRAITDLPIRQCYYWGVERDQTNGEPSDNAMLLIYDDGQNVDFWAGYRTDDSRQAMLAADADGRARWSDYEAPPHMVAELHRQVMELHDVCTAPLPYAVAWIDWGDDPYGGGVNFWNPGVKSWEVMPKIAHPRSELPIFIVGEAYSGAQGWVEGALQTAELVLTGSHFGLRPFVEPTS